MSVLSVSLPVWEKCGSTCMSARVWAGRGATHEGPRRGGHVVEEPGVDGHDAGAGTSGGGGEGVWDVGSMRKRLESTSVRSCYSRRSGAAESGQRAGRSVRVWLGSEVAWRVVAGRAGSVGRGWTKPTDGCGCGCDLEPSFACLGLYLCLQYAAEQAERPRRAVRMRRACMRATTGHRPHRVQRPAGPDYRSQQSRRQIARSSVRACLRCAASCAVRRAIAPLASLAPPGSSTRSTSAA